MDTLFKKASCRACRFLFFVSCIGSMDPATDALEVSLFCVTLVAPAREANRCRFAGLAMILCPENLGPN